MRTRGAGATRVAGVGIRSSCSELKQDRGSAPFTSAPMSQLTIAAGPVGEATQSAHAVGGDSS